MLVVVESLKHKIYTTQPNEACNDGQKGSTILAGADEGELDTNRPYDQESMETFFTGC